MWRTRTVIGLSRNVSQNKTSAWYKGSRICSHDRCILKKKKTDSTFSSLGPNWVLRICGLDKLMGYQSSTFPLAVYECMDTASQKLLFIWAWTSNNNPVYPSRWYFEHLYESKTLPDHIRIYKGSETTIMASMQGFPWLWFTGLCHLFKGFLRRRVIFLNNLCISS